MDVLKNSMLPMLISRIALQRMNGQLDFSTNCLWSDSHVFVQLLLGPNGHLYWPRRAKIDSQIATDHKLVFVSSSEESESKANIISDENLRKLHLHLTHGSFHSTKRILGASKRPYCLRRLRSIIDMLLFTSRTQDHPTISTKLYHPV